MILSSAILPDIVPPGNTFWGWEVILGIGFTGAIAIATAWIIIPAIETPPDGKQEWKDMMFFWTINFLGFLIPALGIVGVANLIYSGFTHSAVQTKIEAHYGGISIEGDIPSSLNSESKFTVILNPEELEEASFLDDEVEEDSLQCRIWTNDEGYLPIECLYPTSNEYVPLKPLTD